MHKYYEKLAALSDQIWDYAELSMLEFKSTAEYIRVLEAQGFTVERNLCGIPTAFSGSFGSGRPVIGILGEYDALSGLSQKAGFVEHKPLTEGGCGQGCGHNLLGAASLGAAMAVKHEIEAGNLQGTVIFYGCPGEEGCAGTPATPTRSPSAPTLPVCRWNTAFRASLPMPQETPTTAAPPWMPLS